MSVHKGDTKGTYKIFVNIPSEGKRRRRVITIHGSRREAERIEREIKSTMDNGTFVSRDRQTLGDFLTSWLETKVSVLKEQSYRGTASSLNHVFNSELNDIQLQQLTADHIQVKINQLHASGRSSGTIKNFRDVLRNALNRAVRLRKIQFNPVLDVEIPRIVRADPNPWSQGNIHRFLNFIHSSDINDEWAGYGHALELVLFTGMRRAEVCGLRWSAVDLENKTLFVTSTRLSKRQGGGFYEDTPKSAAGRRVIQLTPGAIDLLRTIRGQQMEYRIRYPEIKWANDPFVICRFDGTVFRPDTLTKVFHKMTAAAGLPKTTLHNLRHSHATMLNELGYDHAALARRLGHSDVRTTLQIYADFRPAEYSERLEKIDERLRHSGDTIGDKN